MEKQVRRLKRFALTELMLLCILGLMIMTYDIKCQELKGTVLGLNRTMEVSERIYGENIGSTMDQLNSVQSRLDRVQSSLDNANKIINEYRSIEGRNPKLFQELRKVPKQTNRSGYDRQQRTRVTAYSLAYKDCGKHPWHPEYGVTASGNTVADNYTIAAGPSVPFGTKVFIPSLGAWDNGGIFTVEDRGGAIRDGCIDIFIRATNKSDAFGLQYLDTYILK